MRNYSIKLKDFKTINVHNTIYKSIKFILFLGAFFSFLLMHGSLSIAANSSKDFIEKNRFEHLISSLTANSICVDTYHFNGFLLIVFDVCLCFHE